MNPELGGQFGSYHNEILIDGLSGVLPTMPMAFRNGHSAGRAGAVASVERRRWRRGRVHPASRRTQPRNVGRHFPSR